MEVVSIIKDIILSLAAIITAGMAVYGVRSWRRELKGKAEFETARTLMKATYKLRDTIAIVRAPFISAYEFPEEYNAASSHTDRQEANAYLHVFRNRWKPLWEALQEYDTASLEAEAIWGNDIKEQTEKLRKCIITLQVSVDSFISDVHSGQRELDKETKKEVRQNIFATMEAENKLSIQIKGSIENIERQLKPHLKR